MTEPESTSGLGIGFKQQSAIPFVGGILLILIAVHIFRTTPFPTIGIILFLTGTSYMALGIAEMRPGKTTQRTDQWIHQMADFFGVEDAQVLFIGLGIAFALGARAASGDGALSHSPLAIPLWLAGIGLSWLGCRKRDTTIPKGNWSRWEYGLVVLFFLAALFFRTWDTASMPYVLGGDEGSAGLDGIAFIRGDQNNILTVGWFTFPSLYFWLVSLSQRIFGANIEAIRWVSALAGSFTVIALYWTARGMFGRTVAIWSAAWLITFHHHVFFSRLAYNNIWDGLFFILAIGALWRGWGSGSRRYFLMLGLVVGFAQYFYTTARLIPILLAIWILLLSHKHGVDRSRRQGLVCSLLVFVSVALPLGLLYAADPNRFLWTSQRVSMIIPGWTAEAAAALGTSAVGLILEQIWVTALGLVVAEIQGIYAGSGAPLLFGISAVLFAIGLVMSMIRIRDPRYSILILALLGTILVGGLSIEAPSGQRMLLLPPILALIITIPIDAAQTWISDRGRVPDVLAGIGALALVGLMMWQNYDQLFNRYFPTERYGSLNGEVAMEIIHLLQEETEIPLIYFAGGDRMEFDSIPSLAYLLPGVQATELSSMEDLDPADTEGERTFVITLPEEIELRTAIQQTFDDANPIPRYNRHGDLLFYLTIIGSTDQNQ